MNSKKLRRKLLKKKGSARRSIKNSMKFFSPKTRLSLYQSNSSLQQTSVQQSLNKRQLLISKDPMKLQQPQKNLKQEVKSVGTFSRYSTGTLESTSNSAATLTVSTRV
jgi:uncharacterized protein YlxW (UPF0749 family)